VFQSLNNPKNIIRIFFFFFFFIMGNGQIWSMDSIIFSSVFSPIIDSCDRKLDTFFRNLNSGANLDPYFITWAYWEFVVNPFTIQKIYLSIQNVKIWRKKECPILPRHFFGKTMDTLKKWKKKYLKYKNHINMFCYSTRLYSIPFY